MPQINFDPNDMAQLIPYLESLNTVESILENSALIYSSPVACKKAELENIVRFGNLSLESLDIECNKVRTIMNTAIIGDMPVAETTQHFLITMDKLIRHKQDKLVCLEENIDHEFNVIMLENQLFDMDYKYEFPAIECTQVGQNVAVMEYMNAASEFNMLTSTALLEICRNYFASNTLAGMEGAFDTFKDSISSQVMETLNYEVKDPNYRDLPILEAIESVKATLLDDFFDSEDKSCKIKELFDDMENEMKDVVQNHFEKIKSELAAVSSDDPISEPVTEINPFENIYNMAPFPVGSRTVQRTINNCLNATTESELIESLNQFATLMTVCEVFGDEILTEGPGSLVSKARRSMVKGGKRVAATARKVGDNVRRAGDTAKKITDPMIRFIENTYDNIAKADHDERKKIAMTRGFKGKLRRLIKWIRDVGIMGIAAGTASTMGLTVGTVIAAIALVGYIIRNEALDAEARRQVLRELEDELRITREKIEDSRGDEDKQKKYELMRIESKLEKEVSRVKLRLQY